MCSFHGYSGGQGLYRLPNLMVIMYNKKICSSKTLLASVKKLFILKTYSPESDIKMLYIHKETPGLFLYTDAAQNVVIIWHAMNMYGRTCVS
jgi:hypothetical protein